MTTPNGGLIARLRGQAYTTSRPDQLCEQAADALQSQAERMVELEAQLKVSLEGWKCECSTDDACRFARERDALAQQGEPVAYITDTWQGPMVWTPEMYNDACTYCDDGEFPVPLYTVTPRPTSGDYALGYAEGFNDACKPAPQAQDVTELVELLEFMWRDVSMNEYAFEKLEAALFKYKGAK